MEPPLSLRSFPHAILHIDADAFFASCEQAVNPKLKGKPVITGKERGIAAVSYEAKALGIKRGMSIREIQVICPR
jgi:nucleotidyltransferase/DNA polymerase involved in DNA repair